MANWLIVYFSFCAPFPTGDSDERQAVRRSQGADRQEWTLPSLRQPAFGRRNHRRRRRWGVGEVAARPNVSAAAAVCAVSLRPQRAQAILRRQSLEGRLRRDRNRKPGALSRPGQSLPGTDDDADRCRKPVRIRALLRPERVGLESGERPGPNGSRAFRAADMQLPGGAPGGLGQRHRSKAGAEVRDVDQPGAGSDKGMLGAALASRRRAAGRSRWTLLRSAQPDDAVSLRRVEEQAFLRRRSRFDRIQRPALKLRDRVRSNQKNPTSRKAVAG